MKDKRGRVQGLKEEPLSTQNIHRGSYQRSASAPAAVAAQTPAVSEGVSVTAVVVLQHPRAVFQSHCNNTTNYCNSTQTTATTPETTAATPQTNDCTEFCGKKRAEIKIAFWIWLISGLAAMATEDGKESWVINVIKTKPLTLKQRAKFRPLLSLKKCS